MGHSTPQHPHANLASAPIVDVDRVPIAQVREARKHIRNLAGVEPHEVLMITLDKERRPRADLFSENQAGKSPAPS